MANKLRGRTIHKFGYNTVGTSYTPVEPLGTFNWLEAADEVRIKAGGDAADTAAGLGAREVQVWGLNEDYRLITEKVATAGASASAITSQTFTRVFRARVTESGAYGAANTGDIEIETEAGTSLLKVLATEGSSQYGAYSIPVGKTAFIHNLSFIVNSGKSTNIQLFSRKSLDVVAAPFYPATLEFYVPGIVDGLQFNFKNPLKFQEKSDLYFLAKVDATTADVAVDFEIELV